MTLRLNPYLNFDGNAREALEFYHSVLGGDLNISTFEGFGAPEEIKDNVMHGMLVSPDGLTLMVSDMPPGQQVHNGNNFSVSLSGEDADKLRGYWAALSEGGEVRMPLEKQVWGDEFGMLVDRFGVAWMVDIVAH